MIRVGDDLRQFEVVVCMTRMLMVRRKCAPYQEMRFRVLDGLLDRLRGLLGTGGDAQPVALLGCPSIHTFGMRYRIDVAFVDYGGLVLASWRSVPPGRVISSRHAWLALERPHACGPWFARGELIEMQRINEDACAVPVLASASASDA